MLSRWYRTGVIYSLDVGLFQDANGDGIGDFQGLIARLDYLARLGVTTIWIVMLSAVAYLVAQAPARR